MFGSAPTTVFIVLVAVSLGCYQELHANDDVITGAITIFESNVQRQKRLFSGHPGWLDIFPADGSESVSTRIQNDGYFVLPRAAGQGSLIAVFDRMELPPLICPDWGMTRGGITDYDATIIVEYAIVPPGYPAKWEEHLKVTGKDFWQTFVARSSNLYSCMVFDGSRVVSWGNKVNVTLHSDRVNVPLVEFDFPGGGSYLSTIHTDYEFPAVGW